MTQNRSLMYIVFLIISPFVVLLSVRLVYDYYWCTIIIGVRFGKIDF